MGPLPWHVDAEPYAGVVLVDVRDAADSCVAETGDIDNAQFIVRACNAFDEMLGALKAVAMSPTPICAEGHGKACDCGGDLVRAAIAWASRHHPTVTSGWKR